MQRTHLMVGALAAALAGAVSGATINTTPLQRGIDAWDRIPGHEFTEAELAERAAQPTLPDHYAIVTPQGRFEVTELRDRGLYRNRRFGMQWDRSRVGESEPQYAVIDADYRYIPDEAATTAYPVEPPATGPDEGPAVLAADARPLGMIAAAAPVALEVKPRTIDVAAALAAR